MYDSLTDLAEIPATAEDLGRNRVWSGPVEYCLRTVVQVTIPEENMCAFPCVSSKPGVAQVVFPEVRLAGDKRRHLEVKEGDWVLSREAWIGEKRQERRVLAALLIRPNDRSSSFHHDEPFLYTDSGPIHLPPSTIYTLPGYHEPISWRKLKDARIAVIDARA